MCKFPWTRRADEEREERIAAERRLAEVEADWEPVRRHRDAVRREVDLNDWTRTAKAIFGGGRN